jgi:hypothetical protein
MTKPLVSVSVRKKSSSTGNKPRVKSVEVTIVGNGFTVECKHKPGMESLLNPQEAPEPMVFNSLKKAMAHATQELMQAASESEGHEAKEEAGKAEESDEEG